MASMVDAQDRHPRTGESHQLALMTAAARMYYLDRRSHVDIAEELGISRFKVARLIDASRDQGIVRIEIVPKGVTDLDRSARLAKRCGLPHARVVDVAGLSPDHRRRELGAAAARLLCELLSDTDTLGIPWSRSVVAMSDQLDALPPVPVVQLTGSVGSPGTDTSTVDVVRRLKQLTGGTMYRFHAPNLLDDPATAAGLRRQPDVARALAAADAVSIAVVGVGAWRAGSSTFFDAVDEDTRRQVAADGAIGELAGVFIDADGRPRHPDLLDRMIVVDAETLRGIDTVIAIVADAGAADVVRAAVHGGLVQGLVLATDLADRLLTGG